MARDAYTRGMPGAGYPQCTGQDQHRQQQQPREIPAVSGAICGMAITESRLRCYTTQI